jgi:K+-transporting ATPase ATPase A chain
MATGMAVAVAVIRGLARHGSDRLGNFWVDLTRSLLYIVLPLAAVASVVLVATGVPQMPSGASCTPPSHPGGTMQT